MKETVDLVERKKMREIEEHIQFLEQNEEDEAEEEKDFTVVIMFLTFLYFTVNY